MVADAVETLLRHKQNAVLGLATGSSPVPVYDELVRRHASRRLSFADASAFLLDEYVGLRAGHPESYRAVIERAFTAHVDFDPARGRHFMRFSFAGATADMAEAAKRLKAWRK